MSIPGGALETYARGKVQPCASEARLRAILLTILSTPPHEGSSVSSLTFCAHSEPIKEDSVSSGKTLPPAARVSPGRVAKSRRIRVNALAEQQKVVVAGASRRFTDEVAGDSASGHLATRRRAFTRRGRYAVLTEHPFDAPWALAGGDLRVICRYQELNIEGPAVRRLDS